MHINSTTSKMQQFLDATFADIK